MDNITNNVRLLGCGCGDTSVLITKTFCQKCAVRWTMRRWTIQSTAQTPHTHVWLDCVDTHTCNPYDRSVYSLSVHRCREGIVGSSVGLGRHSSHATPRQEKPESR